MPFLADLHLKLAEFVLVVRASCNGRGLGQLSRICKPYPGSSLTLG